MSVVLYGIANCDTIKKTRRWLDQHGVDYQFHDYKKLGLDDELAGQLLEQFAAERIINTRGTTWRKLAEPKPALDDHRAVSTLMQASPSVVKRPIIRSGQHWLLGYDEDELATLLG